MRSATKNKVGRDPQYLAWIHTHPCCVCVALAQDQDNPFNWGGQNTPTEAAHVGPRGMSQKCPDRETLPLCAEHHREGQCSQHGMGKLFWAHYGLSREALLAAYQSAYEARFGVAVLSAREVVA